MYMSCLWQQFQDEILHRKIFTKKAPDIFWIQVQDINISDLFYKIQNLKKWKIKAVVPFLPTYLKLYSPFWRKNPDVVSSECLDLWGLLHWYKKIKVIFSFVMCHVSPVTCHISHVLLCLLPQLSNIRHNDFHLSSQYPLLDSE